MIRTSKQLKDKVRNLSRSNSMVAQTLIRNFMMERFLERIALSKYRNNFILKGGMLVSAVIGIETRATMDIDTTVKALPLDMERAKAVIQDIIGIEIDDGVTFRITKMTDIMEGHDYPGIRFMLEATQDKLRQVIKIDISTGDVITPGAIEYAYKLMFEDRYISLWTYNLETLLGEKMETVMSRGTANTRMRDFYDIHTIVQQEKDHLDFEILKKAFYATCRKRESDKMIPQISSIMEDIQGNTGMMKDWENYRKDNYYVGDVGWNDVLKEVCMLADIF